MHFFPDPGHPVELCHPRNGQRLQKTVPITAVLYRALKPLSCAVFTDLPPAEKRSRRTEHTEIVHGLYHRHPFRHCGIKNRRTHKMQGVVHMHHIHTLLPDDPPYVKISLPRK